MTSSAFPYSFWTIRRCALRVQPGQIRGPARFGKLLAVDLLRHDFAADCFRLSLVPLRAGLLDFVRVRLDAGHPAAELLIGIAAAVGVKDFFGLAAGGSGGGEVLFATGADEPLGDFSHVLLELDIRFLVFELQLFLGLREDGGIIPDGRGGLAVLGGRVVLRRRSGGRGRIDLGHRWIGLGRRRRGGRGLLHPVLNHGKLRLGRVPHRRLEVLVGRGGGVAVPGLGQVVGGQGPLGRLERLGGGGLLPDRAVDLVEVLVQCLSAFRRTTWRGRPTGGFPWPDGTPAPCTVRRLCRRRHRPCRRRRPVPAPRGRRRSRR